MEPNDTDLIRHVPSELETASLEFSRELVVAQGKLQQVLRVVRKEGGSAIVVRSMAAVLDSSDYVLQRTIPIAEAIGKKLPLLQIFIDGKGRLCALLDDIPGEPLMNTRGDGREGDRRYLECVKLIAELHGRDLGVGTLESCLFWITKDGALLLLPPVGGLQNNAFLPVSRETFVQQDVSFLLKLYEELRSTSVTTLSSRVSLDPQASVTPGSSIEPVVRRLLLVGSDGSGGCSTAVQLQSLLLEGANRAKPDPVVEPGFASGRAPGAAGNNWGRRVAKEQRGAEMRGQLVKVLQLVAPVAQKLPKRVRVVAVVAVVVLAVAGIQFLGRAPEQPQKRVEAADEPIVAPQPDEIPGLVATLRKEHDAWSQFRLKQRLLAFGEEQKLATLSPLLRSLLTQAKNGGVSLSDQYLWEVAFGGIVGSISADRIIELHPLAPQQVELLLLSLVLDLAQQEKVVPQTVAEALARMQRQGGGSSGGTRGSSFYAALSLPAANEFKIEVLLPLLRKLSDAELLDLGSVTAKTGSVNLALEAAKEAKERGLLTARNAGFIELVTKEAGLGNDIKLAVLRTSLGIASVNDVRVLSFWPARESERVLWTICLESADEDARSEAFDLATRRLGSSAVLEVFVKTIKERAWEDRAKFVRLLGAVALQDARMKDLVVELDTFAARPLLVARVIETANGGDFLTVLLQRYAQEIPINGLLRILRAGTTEARLLALTHLKGINDASVIQEIVRSYERERDGTVREQYEKEFWFIQERLAKAQR